ncbi:MAG: GNAT family N-acetyltransferase [Euzebya sp.]
MDFRELTDDDLLLLHGWLNGPGVVRWWEGEDVTWETVVRDYGSQNTEPVEYWIAIEDGVEVGWIQCYAASSFADEEETAHWFRLGIHQSAGGIDYLIGSPEQRRKGIGSAMIQAFVSDIVFPRHPEWTQVCASPVAANIASWRALEKAGFTHRASFTDKNGLCKLMVRDRDSDPAT